jgi:hypothetical protein
MQLGKLQKTNKHMNKIIIAIDPGANGGMAVQWRDGKVTAFTFKSQSDWCEEIDGILDHGGIIHRTLVCYIEKVGGYVGGKGAPGSSMFNFGHGVGFMEGYIHALEVPTTLIRPQEWQKRLSLGTSKSHASKTKWKNHLKDAASRLFPEIKVTLKTADALLILRAAQLIENV